MKLRVTSNMHRGDETFEAIIDAAEQVYGLKAETRWRPLSWLRRQLKRAR